MMFTPTQAIEAIKARISGEWENEQLLKVGPLAELLMDIAYILDNTLPCQSTKSSI